MKALSLEQHFSPLQVYRENFCQSRASNSKANSLIWPEIELVRDFKPDLVTTKFDKEVLAKPSLETPFSHYTCKSMGNVLDTQGHLTPKGVV